MKVNDREQVIVTFSLGKTGIKREVSGKGERGVGWDGREAFQVPSAESKRREPMGF